MLQLSSAVLPHACHVRLIQAAPSPPEFPEQYLDHYTYRPWIHRRRPPARKFLLCTGFSTRGLSNASRTQGSPRCSQLAPGLLSIHAMHTLAQIPGGALPAFEVPATHSTGTLNHATPARDTPDSTPGISAEATPGTSGPAVPSVYSYLPAPAMPCVCGAQVGAPPACQLVWCSSCGRACHAECASALPCWPLLGDVWYSYTCAVCAEDGIDLYERTPLPAGQQAAIVSAVLTCNVLASEAVRLHSKEANAEAMRCVQRLLETAEAWRRRSGRAMSSVDLRRACAVAARAGALAQPAHLGISIGRMQDLVRAFAPRVLHGLAIDQPAAYATAAWASQVLQPLCDNHSPKPTAHISIAALAQAACLLLAGQPVRPNLSIAPRDVLALGGGEWSASKRLQPMPFHFSDAGSFGWAIVRHETLLAQGVVTAADLAGIARISTLWPVITCGERDGQALCVLWHTSHPMLMPANSTLDMQQCCAQCLVCALQNCAGPEVLSDALHVCRGRCPDLVPTDPLSKAGVATAEMLHTALQAWMMVQTPHPAVLLQDGLDCASDRTGFWRKLLDAVRFTMAIRRSSGAVSMDALEDACVSCAELMPFFQR